MRTNFLMVGFLTLFVFSLVKTPSSFAAETEQTAETAKELILEVCGSTPGSIEVLAKLYHSNQNGFSALVQNMKEKDIVGGRIWGAYKYIASENIDDLVKFINEYNTDQDIRSFVDTTKIDVDAFMIHWQMN